VKSTRAALVNALQQLARTGCEGVPSHRAAAAHPSPVPSFAVRLLALAPLLYLPPLVHLLDPTWIYSDPKYPDAWLYWGIANNFAYWSSHVSDLYFFTRYAWTIPNAALYAVVDPVSAKLIWHFSIFYLAVLSLYGIIRSLADYTTALVGALVLSFDRWFLRSLGWDYIDGAGTAYLLFALYLLTVAARRGDTGHGRSLLTLLAGFVAGLVVNVYPPTVAFLPCLAVYAAAVSGRRDLRRLARPSLMLGFGFLLCLLLILAAHRVIAGTFDLVSPNQRIVQAIQTVPTSHVPPIAERVALWSIDSRFVWLFVPLAIAVAMGARLVAVRIHGRALTPLARSAFAYYGATLVILAGWELFSFVSMVQWRVHFAYWMPGTYLALAALFEMKPEERTRDRQALVVVALAAGGVLALGGYETLIDAAGGAPRLECATDVVAGCFAVRGEVVMRAAQALMLAACAVWVVLAVGGWTPRLNVDDVSRAALIGMAVAGLLLGHYSAFRNGHKVVWNEGQDDRQFYLLLVDAVGLIEEVFPEGVVGIAYRDPTFLVAEKDLDPSQGTDYVGRAIWSSFGVYRWPLSMKLPAVPCAPGSLRPQERQVVIGGWEESIGDLGRAAVERCGVHLRLLGHRRLERGGFTYHLFFFAGERAA
jgi:hypothetical protein